MATDETRALPGVRSSSSRGRERRRRARARVPALTVLCHPDARRVGEVAALPELSQGQGASLSRLAPRFGQPGDAETAPLGDLYLSRTPVRLLAAREPGGVLLVMGECRCRLEADGQPVVEARDFSAADLARGVTLELAGRVVLLLHSLPAEPYFEPDDFGLVGASEAICQVRREIRRVADLEVPVLLRGETGTGKELVARGIHRTSRRAEQIYLGVNLGAIPPSLATAELFGSVKGAFTGSVRSQVGYFQRAHRGTLFLDEIGDSPAEIQVMLLRVLETGEVQKVGSQDPQSVDVRLIAATDVDLEEAIAAGRFRAPLLHRLSGYEILIPPLRERRDDCGRLLYAFLRRELAEIAEADRLEAPEAGAPSWMPASIVARLVRHDWPGNVRQLRNVARQLVIASRGAEVVQVAPQVERLLREVEAPEPSGIPEPAAEAAASAVVPPVAPAPPAYRKPSEVSIEELLAALEDNRYKIKPTAAQLGVSRSSLYGLIDRCPEVRKASELSRQEIVESLDRCGGDLEAMVDRLRVSADGLRQRMRELGLEI